MFRFGGTHEGPANLIPFKTILPYLRGSGGVVIGGINIIGNIVLLVPVGLLVAIIFGKLSWKKMLAVASGAGLLIETMQEVLQVGIFDIDDVMLNGLGVIIGFWLFAIFSKWIRSGNYKAIGITAAVVVAFAVAAVYAIYPRGNQRINSMHREQKSPADLLPEKEDNMLQGADPCKGTGGTGQIVSVADNTLTIKAANGTNKMIKLTDKTIMRNSMGPATKFDLKTGDEVTVVIDESETAALVLICSGS
jgi:preprotein translocase subunit YajC